MTLELVDHESLPVVRGFRYTENDLDRQAVSGFDNATHIGLQVAVVSLQQMKILWIQVANV